MSKAKVEIQLNFRSFSFKDMFNLAQKTQVDGVDYIFSLQDFWNNKKLKAISILSQKVGIPVLSLHQPLYLIPYTPSFLFRRMISLSTYFPQAKDYVLHLSSAINYFQQDAKKVFKINQFAKTYNLVLALESNTMFSILRYYPRITYDPNVFADFCIKNGLKITLDTSHISVCGGNILEFYKKYNKHIEMIHLSDYKKGVEHLPLGDGNLPIKDFLKIIKQTHYSRHICLEIDNFPKAKNKNDTLSQLGESVSLVREYLS